MKAGWWIALDGDQSALQQLAARLTGGAVAVEAERVDPPRVGAVVFVDEGGRKQHFVSVGSSLTMSFEVEARVERPQPDGSVNVYDVGPPLPRVPELVSAAIHDEDLRDALAVLGRPDLTWHDLYYVFEIVEANIGGAMFANGWITKRAVTSFTQTANSRHAVGRDARHGHTKVPAPSQPMALNDAQALVTGLVQQWFGSLVPPPPPRDRLIEIRSPSDVGARISDEIGQGRTR